MKDCPTCRTPRDLSEFSRNASRPGGLHGECKSCARQRAADWRLANPERRRQRDRERRGVVSA